jgi:Protein of unknown function (DUF4240)
MTATYQIKSAALNPQFIHELTEKYGETELEIRVQTGGARSKILSDTQFWQIIDLLDWQESGDNEAVVAPLITHLASLPVSFIYQFSDKLSEKLFHLDTRLHAASFSLPFSVDDFLYSRCAVVANGKKVFDDVLADPSKMPTDIDFEPLLYVASDAYTLKTGKNFEYVADFPIETRSNKKSWA